MVFIEPILPRSSDIFLLSREPRRKRKFTASLMIILLLTSMLVITLPVSNVSAQPDGFEYFVHGETSIKKVDEDMDGYFETARIFYDVDSTVAYAEIKVLCLVYDDTTDKLVKELSDTYTIFRNIDLKETYFDFKAGYTGIFNFTLEVYDNIHNHQEYGGNDYPIGNTTLEINPNRYDLIVDATAYDADADGYNDDVRITVLDTLNYTISGASVYIDGTYRGQTNESGSFFQFNIPRGIHEVDAFYHGLHGNSDFRSEGTGQQVMIYADADPFDEDQDGYVDDVLIRAFAYNYYPLPNADVYIDWMYYGTTNQQGILYAYDFDLGFHDVYVISRNFQTQTTFYAEEENATNINMYFFWVDARVATLDNDNHANDIEVYIDVDISDGKTANVTVNATVYYQNQTVAYEDSIKYQTTGYEIEDEFIYFYNLTNNLSYDIVVELFNEQNELEDVWFFEEIVIQYSFGNINVDKFVLDLNDDNHLNDVIFWAHIKGEPYSNANVRVYFKANTTMVNNVTTARSGYAVIENMYYSNYTWTAYDENNNVIDNGTFELYDRNPLRTVQLRVRTFDVDRDDFHDDFEVLAYDERDLPDNNVTVKIIDFKTKKTVKQGFTSALSSDGFGRFLIEDLREGFYTYTASITFGIINPEFHLISTGWFYSYGNSTESTHNLNAFAQEFEADGDGYVNDVKISVKDRNGQPVMNALVYFDNDIQNSNTTDQNGELIGKDFPIGWHDVNVIFLGSSQTVPTGSQAYTRFYSQGENFDEYFFNVDYQINDENDDGEWNDLNFTFDVDVNADTTVNVIVEIDIHYSLNDTIAAHEEIKYEIYNGWLEWENLVIYNLTYNEKYYANITLKDELGNIEDNLIRENIIIANITPLVNLDLEIYYWPQLNITIRYIVFYAHILNQGIENITVSVYHKNNKTLFEEKTTDLDGFVTFFNIIDGDYYYKSYNGTGGHVEYGEFSINTDHIGTIESQSDFDLEGYFDDFSYGAYYFNQTFRGIEREPINLTIVIKDIYGKTVATGHTADYEYFSFNFTEGHYKFISTYESQRVTNGSFYSYGNGFVNSPPVAVIDKPIDQSDWLTKDTITFDATGSYDPDPQDIITFYWTSNISGPIGYKKTFNRKLPEGIHKITLFVDDGRGSGHNVSKFVTINVQKPIINETNTLPIADAGNPQPNVPINTTVTLDGSGSYDTDGYITEYNWTKDSGPAATLNDSTYVKPTFYANKLGTYVWKLGVMDNKSAWSAVEDTVTITVIKNRAPIINISSPLNSTFFNTTDIIFFNSTGTYDPDDDLNGNGIIDGSEQDNLTYSWAVRKGNETPFINSNQAHFNSTIINTFPVFEAGVHYVNLTIVDLLDFNATMEIEINISNVPPVPLISTPSEDQLFWKNNGIFMDGSGTTDEDNITVDLYFYWEVQKLGSSDIFIFTNDSTPSIDDGLVEGDYQATLWVNDGVGIDLFGRDHNVSTMVNFTVENRAPIADAGENLKVTLGDTVTFNGSGSWDQDGSNDEDNFTYEWDFGDGNTDTGIEVSHIFTEYPDLNDGNYSVILTVTDTGSLQNTTGTDTINITINRPPVADPGEDLEGEVDIVIMLDGSKSSDPDGDKLLYMWTFVGVDDDFEWSTSPFLNVTFTDPGIYTAVLHVNDSLAENNKSIEITIIKANRPPVCEAGPDIDDVDIDETINFSGFNSYDMDDDALEFTWDFGDESKPETGMNVTHSYSENGIYTVTLNITDGVFWANDTLEVTVRPPAPEIEFPNDDDDVEKTVIISGKASGRHISKVEIRIGNGPWKTVLPFSTDDYSEWTYDWDTTKEDNGEVDIQLRTRTSYASSTITKITVNVDNPPELDIKITSHSTGSSLKGVATLSGTAAGDTLQKVEVKIGDENYEDAKDNSAANDWSTWSFRWDTRKFDDDTYTIVVRVLDENGVTETDSITVKVSNAAAEPTAPDTEEAENLLDQIMGMGMMVLGACVVIIFIIILLIIFMVTRSRRRKRVELEFEEQLIREREERRREKEKERELEESKISEEQLAEIIKQPIRCPNCKEYSVIEDDGERPLMIECVHCGVKGFIGEQPKLLEGPKLPKKFEEEEKLIIQCPKCDEMFTTEDETGEIICPNCAVRGQLNEETIIELKNRQEEMKELMRQQAQAQEEEMDKGGGKKDSDTGEKEFKRIKCPNCSEKFKIPADARRIECPSCGASGSL